MNTLLASLTLGTRSLFDPAVLAVLARSLVVTLLAFVAAAVLGWWALDTLLVQAGLGDALFAGAGELRGLLSLGLAALGLWLLWRIIAMAVVQFFADEVVIAVELRHYPEAAALARDLTMWEQARMALVAGLRALLAHALAMPIALALLVTGIGPAVLFWLVNALLLARELRDMVWQRHRHAEGERAPAGFWRMFALGLVISALLAVPLLSFLAPVLGAACATHLMHRQPQTRPPNLAPSPEEPE